MKSSVDLFHGTAIGVIIRPICGSILKQLGCIGPAFSPPGGGDRSDECSTSAASAPEGDRLEDVEVRTLAAVRKDLLISETTYANQYPNNRFL